MKRWLNARPQPGLPPGEGETLPAFVKCPAAGEVPVLTQRRNCEGLSSPWGVVPSRGSATGEGGQQLTLLSGQNAGYEADIRPMARSRFDRRQLATFNQQPSPPDLGLWILGFRPTCASVLSHPCLKPASALVPTSGSHLLVRIDNRVVSEYTPMARCRVEVVIAHAHGPDCACILYGVGSDLPRPVINGRSHNGLLIRGTLTSQKGNHSVWPPGRINAAIIQSGCRGTRSGIIPGRLHPVGFWWWLLITLLGACARATARQSHGQQRHHYDLDAFRSHMPALIKIVPLQHSMLSDQLQTWLNTVFAGAFRQSACCGFASDCRPWKRVTPFLLGRATEKVFETYLEETLLT